MTTGHAQRDVKHQEATHIEQEHTQANEVPEGIPSGMGPRHKSMVYLNPNEVVFMKNQLESDHKMSDSNLKFATEVERPSFSKANFRPTRKPNEFLEHIMQSRDSIDSESNEFVMYSDRRVNERLQHTRKSLAKLDSVDSLLLDENSKQPNSSVEKKVCTIK